MADTGDGVLAELAHTHMPLTGLLGLTILSGHASSVATPIHVGRTTIVIQADITRGATASS
ncbi:MAG: hypothetical protein ACFCVK_06975 [Acidimicrobiales bacterium]